MSFELIVLGIRTQRDFLIIYEMEIRNKFFFVERYYFANHLHFTLNL